eukprot:TRINITY_DN8359_c0_g1_i1.p1 TRINITY_DN8359_c0_g1~~TRINITY_DN8359_c0_g1_i1.p1  ORF type:complete len:600 (+),score=140.03 TRINITY_DN8359_c0_g1_i1:778-2577(+)
MSGAASLTNAVINLLALRESGRLGLTEVLDSMKGPKALVLDPRLSGPLGLIAEVALLREHGVDKIFHLGPQKVETECKNVIYLVRPRTENMELVAEQIHEMEKAGMSKDYSVFFVPRRTMICERVLEEKGVYGDVTLGEFDLDLIPFDEDVLSLELDTSFRECFLDGDRTALYYVARSIIKLQALYGEIPNIKGKGSCSKAVRDMILRMQAERSNDGPPVASEIDTLILLDRDVDLFTPLCTQLTYEGLVDELFGISNSYVDLEPEVLGQSGVKKVKTPLNSNDKLYSEIRDLNFSVLGPLLNKKATYISENYKERHQAQTVSQIRDFMKKLNTLQQEHNSLRIHTNIAEKISAFTRSMPFSTRIEAEQALLVGPDTVNDTIEEAINKQEPLTRVLRMICLQSLTNNGIKSKYFDFLRREILQTYGYEKLFTLENLQRLGMFKRQDSKGPWAALRKNLHLIVEDCNEQNPKDISYAYSGYAPLSVRLIQYAIKPGWRSIEDSLRILPGPTFEETQELSPGARDASASQSSHQRRRNVTLVYFIGGVTYAEISAIRFLAQQEEGNRDYIIATTKLINGDTLLESVFEEVDNNLLIGHIPS